MYEYWEMGKNLGLVLNLVRAARDAKGARSIESSIGGSLGREA